MKYLTMHGAPALKVHLIYEDTETGLRAKQAVDRLGERFNLETDACLNPWRFDRLWEPTLREQALNEAAEADILLVSAHGQDELPPAILAWLEQWLASDHAGPRALVLSFDARARGSTGANQILASLHAAARLAGVDVLPHFGATLTPDWEMTIEDLHYRAEAQTVLLNDALLQVEQHTRWGINE